MCVCVLSRSVSEPECAGSGSLLLVEGNCDCVCKDRGRAREVASREGVEMRDEVAAEVAEDGAFGGGNGDLVGAFAEEPGTGEPWRDIEESLSRTIRFRSVRLFTRCNADILSAGAGLAADLLRSKFNLAVSSSSMSRLF